MQAAEIGSNSQDLVLQIGRTDEIIFIVEKQNQPITKLKRAEIAKRRKGAARAEGEKRIHSHQIALPGRDKQASE